MNIFSRPDCDAQVKTIQKKDNKHLKIKISAVSTCHGWVELETVFLNRNIYYLISSFVSKKKDNVLGHSWL